MRIKLKTLTPVKIGAGETQDINNINSFVHNEELVVYDIEKLLSSNVEKIDGIISGINSKGGINKYFNKRIKEKESFWKYHVPIKDDDTIKEIHRGSDIEPQIMLPDNTFYIPGSSIKGALRTNLLTKYILENPMRWHGNRGNLKDPDQHLRIGKNDPQRDLMKAFEVTDSTDKKPSESGTVLSIKTYSKKTGGSLEPKHWTTVHVAIDEGQEFEFEININEKMLEKIKDEWRNGKKVDGVLGGTGEKEIIDRVFDSCSEISKERLDIEDKFLLSLSNSYDFNNLNFLVEDLKYELDEGGCIFNLGFGVGRLGTTVQLSAKEDEVKRNLRKMSRARRYQQDDLNIDYPKSRKYYLQNGKPAGLLGWVKLEKA